MSRHAGRQPAGEDGSVPGSAVGQRIDKWLWYVRVVKSRTLASALVTAGKVRVNRSRIAKSSATVSPGDVVTIAAGQRVRVLKVLAAGTRRGPPTEAQALYEDLTPPPPAASAARGAAAGDASGAASDARAKAPQRDAGSGRPTKLERRRIDQLRGRNDDH